MDYTNLYKIIEKAQKDKTFLGGSIGLHIKGNNVCEYFGFLDENETIKINSNNLFDCASLSKVIVTTTLILLMQERGMLSIFDKVCLFLPEFKHKDITLFHLLTHCSGLPSDVYNVCNIFDKQSLITLIYNMPLTYKFGEKIVYSDIGFILLGFIIEKLFNKSLGEVARDLVFEPLNMTHSCYCPKNKDICVPTEYSEHLKVRIQGCVHDEKARLLNGNAGHAGLFSTCDDILKYLNMILNNGKIENKTFLTKSSIELLFNAMVAEKVENTTLLEQRSIGYLIKGYNPSCGMLVSDQTIYHTGFTGCNLFVDRINRICFVFLTNRVYYGRSNLKLITLRPRLANFIVANLL